MATTCQKEGPDCHFSITIKNNTSKDIIHAMNFKNTSDKCNLSGTIIKPSEKYELTINECWESSLADGQPTEFYLIDPDHLNSPNIYYDCDSIEIKNKVLKHYKLTLDDLKKLDFTITYP